MKKWGSMASSDGATDDLTAMAGGALRYGSVA